MKAVILADGTRIENISDSSTADAILAIRANYAEAGAVRDIFTDANTSSFEIVDENGQKIVSASFIKLLPGAELIESADGIICQTNFRAKTDIEKLQDQITELQDVVIGE